MNERPDILQDTSARLDRAESTDPEQPLKILEDLYAELEAELERDIDPRSRRSTA